MGKLVVQLFFIFILILFNDSHIYGMNQKISVYHPNTNKIVATIEPAPFQLETNFISFEQDVRRKVHQLGMRFYQGMILDRLDEKGNIIEGRPEIFVDERKLAEDILALSFSGGKVPISFKTRNSGYQQGEANSLTEAVIASYTTYYNILNIGRSTNIERSAASIHNVIVGSGDTFSFNLMVGLRKLDFGYKVAPEIINGKVVLGVGGGICQTSSTLFNAVDQLGIKIIERHHHSRDIGYVPKGRDATVSFGGLDFKFQNTSGIPFVIKTYAKNGILTVLITTSKEYEQLLKNELSE